MARAAETEADKGVFSKASVRDARVAGKKVLVRADFNVPLDHGIVKDDARIRAALPTIELLRDRGAMVVLCSHLGRPDGEDPDYSMAPIAARLAELLGTYVAVAPGVVGDDVAGVVAGLDSGEVLLLENTRFDPGETKNDPELAEALAHLADVYVNDAFGAAHRAHASTEGVAHHIPAYAGLLLEREVRELTSVLADPARPLVVVLGGAKVSDKIGVIDRFLEIADKVLIGGAMCFSFFRAQGHETGNSLVEEEGIGLAEEVLARAAESDCELLLPTDLVLGEAFSADSDRRSPRRHRRPRGHDGPRRRPGDGGRLRRGDRRCRHRLLERADGRLRAAAVRGGDEGGRRGGRRLQGDHGRRRRRLRRGAGAVRPRRQGRAGSRPAAAPRSSSSRARSCRASRRCSTRRPPMPEPERRPLIAANWKMQKTIGEARAFCAEFLPTLDDAPAAPRS